MNAAIVSVIFRTQAVIITWFDNDDPVLEAEQMKDKMVDEFPNYEHCVVADKEAWQVSARRLRDEIADTWMGEELYGQRPKKRD